jgi:hypothetical protein
MAKCVRGEMEGTANALYDDDADSDVAGIGIKENGSVWKSSCRGRMIDANKNRSHQDHTIRLTKNTSANVGSVVPVDCERRYAQQNC